MHDSLYKYLQPIPATCIRNMVLEPPHIPVLNPVYWPARFVALQHIISTILTKTQYNDGIPENTRFAQHDQFGDFVKELETPAGKEKIRKVKELTVLAHDGMSWLLANWIKLLRSDKICKQLCRLWL